MNSLITDSKNSWIFNNQLSSTDKSQLQLITECSYAEATQTQMIEK